MDGIQLRGMTEEEALKIESFFDMQTGDLGNLMDRVVDISICAGFSPKPPSWESFVCHSVGDCQNCRYINFPQIFGVFLYLKNEARF